jgi:hypothetical protein
MEGHAVKRFLSLDWLPYDVLAYALYLVAMVGMAVGWMTGTTDHAHVAETLALACFMMLLQVREDAKAKPAPKINAGDLHITVTADTSEAERALDRVAARVAATRRDLRP